MAKSDNPTTDMDGEVSFTDAQQKLFNGVRSELERSVSDMTPVEQHKALLGAASELVDAAADLAAKHHPGVRVVELGLLAERIGQLACYGFEDADPQSGQRS